MSKIIYFRLKCFFNWRRTSLDNSTNSSDLFRIDKIDINPQISRYLLYYGLQSLINKWYQRCYSYLDEKYLLRFHAALKNNKNFYDLLLELQVACYLWKLNINKSITFLTRHEKEKFIRNLKDQDKIPNITHPDFLIIVNDKYFFIEVTHAQSMLNKIYNCILEDGWENEKCLKELQALVSKYGKKYSQYTFSSTSKFICQYNDTNRVIEYCLSDWLDAHSIFYPASNPQNFSEARVLKIIHAISDYARLDIAHICELIDNNLPLFISSIIEGKLNPKNPSDNDKLFYLVKCLKDQNIGYLLAVGSFMPDLPIFKSIELKNEVASLIMKNKKLIKPTLYGDVEIKLNYLEDEKYNWVSGFIFPPSINSLKDATRVLDHKQPIVKVPDIIKTIGQ